MKYRGMFVEITPETGIEREDMDGSIKLCSGSRYRIYSDSEMQDMTDEFCAAVGFELPDDSTDKTRMSYGSFPKCRTDAAQIRETSKMQEFFAREYIDCEFKRLAHENNEQKEGGIAIAI